MTSASRCCSRAACSAASAAWLSCASATPCAQAQAQCVTHCQPPGETGFRRAAAADGKQGLVQNYKKEVLADPPHPFARRPCG
jgi:hypothetical protein